MKIELYKSDRAGKKYKIVLVYGDGKTKTIHIGQAGADDFTTHKDEKRKQAYITRHKKRENWTKSGIDTAGFWSRWLTWNKPSLSASIKYIEEKFNVNIISK